MKNKINFMIILCLFFPLAMQACESSRATRTETVTTRTVDQETAEDNNRGYISGDQDISETSRVETKSTDIEETEEEPEERGVIGATFHFIGQVIALPFRIVVAVIDFIF